MKYLLHIDTSTDSGKIAISGNRMLLTYSVNEETRNHASTLNKMINEALSNIKLSLPAIDAIVVCAGPGSYTGLRIGLATAKGICYALDKPLLLNNRLTLLAYQNYIKHRHTITKYLSVLIAREKEYFISIYDTNFICILPPCHIGEEELKKIILADENIQIITNVQQKTINSLNISNLKINFNIEINLSSWSLYAFEQYNCNNIVNLSTAEPFYLKQFYAYK